jgi:hypothetical protein
VGTDHLLYLCSSQIRHDGVVSLWLCNEMCGAALVCVVVLGSVVGVLSMLP